MKNVQCHGYSEYRMFDLFRFTYLVLIIKKALSSNFEGETLPFWKSALSFLLKNNTLADYAIFVFNTTHLQTVTFTSILHDTKSNLSLSIQRVLWIIRGSTVRVSWTNVP